MKRFTWLMMFVCSVLQLNGMHRFSKVVAQKHVHKSKRVQTPTTAPITKRDLQTMISISDEYFGATPGYQSVKKRLYTALEKNNQNALRGYVFELEAAHDLPLKGCGSVCAFHKKCAHPQYMYVREFDIITDVCAIECKCINWDSVRKSDYIAEQLATQFIEQAELVKSGTVEVPYFMVCSKNPIPFEWKVWFMQRSILYMEVSA